MIRSCSDVRNESRVFMRIYGVVSVLLVTALAASGADRVQAVTTEKAPFRDVTVDTGLSFQHFNGMSGRLYYVEVVGAGGALFDYDDDGDLDLYLVQGAMLGADLTPADARPPWEGGEPPIDRLFRNELWTTERDAGGRMRFVDVTRESGIRAARYGMGAAAADVDNDGRIDLYVLNYGRNELWRNTGDGKFVERAEAWGVDEGRWSVSASFTDLDRDGWLDLAVANYLDYSYVSHRTCLTERGEPDYCLPNGYEPVADALFRNTGGGFEDVSMASGIGKVAANGMGVVAADFDGDGLADLYVANDLMANNLWLQQRDGTFVDDGLFVGAALSKEGKAEASMGVTAGDPDADGDFDLFLTHFRREKNTFYEYDGDEFSDVSVRVQLAGPSWDATAFGTSFVDFDNDGWLDLVAVNGAVTFRPGVDRKRSPFPLDEPNQLFRNVATRAEVAGAGGVKLEFDDVTADAGPAFAASHVSRGVLVGDLDNDGDADLVITNNSGPARVLLNEAGQDNPWIGLRVLQVVTDTNGASARRDALGAVVEIVPSAQSGEAAATSVAGDGPKGRARRLLRRVTTDGGYASSSDPRALFGLGDFRHLARDRGVVDAVVLWPDGKRERFRELPIGRYHEVVAGTGEPLEEGASRAPQ